MPVRFTSTSNIQGLSSLKTATRTLAYTQTSSLQWSFLDSFWLWNKSFTIWNSLIYMSFSLMWVVLLSTVVSLAIYSCFFAVPSRSHPYNHYNSWCTRYPTIVNILFRHSATSLSFCYVIVILLRHCHSATSLSFCYIIVILLHHCHSATSLSFCYIIGIF